MVGLLSLSGSDGVCMLCSGDSARGRTVRRSDSIHVSKTTSEKSPEGIDNVQCPHCRRSRIDFERCLCLVVKRIKI